MVATPDRSAVLPPRSASPDVPGETGQTADLAPSPDPLASTSLTSDSLPEAADLPEAKPLPANLPTPNALVPLQIIWQRLPDGFRLDDKPVDNTDQPLLAGALRESLELANLIQPEMLIATNFGLCATINTELVLKAPDWVYVPRVKKIVPTRRSYTPYLEGDVPAIVMEFLSKTDGGEYSSKPTYPPGKWFFYEQVLKIPTYIIFDDDGGLLEVYRLRDGVYQLEQPDEFGHHWMAELQLFLGTWQGPKLDRTGYWLRWWDRDRTLLPWAVEKVELERQQTKTALQRAEAEAQRAETEAQRAEAEAQRAEAEAQRAEAEAQRAEVAQQQAEAEAQRAEVAQQQAEAERQRADRLAALLRLQGIDPD
jgi:Putative restriction endonuclease